MHRLRTTAIIGLGVLAGCGALKTRNALPASAGESATIDGFNHVRYWGDVIDGGLQESMVESWHQEGAYRLRTTGEQTVAEEASYLAISGGGQDGAFGAGLLNGWTASGKRPVFKVVTGISTGALICPFAFLGPDYDKPLREVYTTVNMKDIAVLRGLFDLLRGDSAYNTAPLVKLVEKCFTHEMIDKIAEEHRKGRRLFVGTTFLDAQRPIVWDMGKIACSSSPKRDELFRKVLLASSAIPGAFSPVYIDVIGSDGKPYDELHVDGGVTREMFLMPSELRLFELRARQGITRKTHLYVLRNSRLEPAYDAVKPKIAPIAEASIATLIKAQAMGDIVQLFDEAMTDDMSFHLASIPPDIADDSTSMFDSQYMARLFDRGYEIGSVGDAWQRSPHDWRRGLLPKPPTTRPTD
ncbi:MAG: patatin-like phospholipase family protein [Tepidisphaeraceae bacterium]